MSDETTVSLRKIPRQARARATCDAALEAAAWILQHQGIGAVTTNAVAERAQIAIGSLYQYFPGKAALLSELLRRQRAQMLAHLSEAATTCEDLTLAEALPRLLAASVAHQRADPARAAALAAAEAQLPPDPQAQALSRQIMGVVVEVLATHRLREPEVAARDLIALTRALHEAAWRAGDTDADAILRRVQRAAAGYLGLSPD